MYYLLNLMFITFISITIALVYDGTAPYGFILAFLLIAVCLHLITSAYATSEYLALEERVKKLENRKEDK